jgi:coenzyme F420 biosynthesis associated uncharacterized protein
MGHDGWVIDWTLTERIASFVAGEPLAGSPRPQLAEVSADSERVVTGYTGLRPPAPLPAPELLTRRDWARANQRSLRSVLDPLSDGVGDGLGVAAPVVRGAVGAVLAAEIGVALGYLSRRVLGQYEVVLLDAEAPARLLFVGPNLDEAARTLDAGDDELLRWVALHEVTHALQFAGVPWLREHLAGMLRELVASMEVSLDPARVLRVPTRDDLRTLADAVAAGDLVSLVTTPAQRGMLDRMQATMAVLEGYAEHVMDAAGAELLPSLERLRAAMDRRRASASAPARVLQRLLGLELKLRQYRLGKAFCDAVVARGGIGALNRVWDAPGVMPTLAELEQPDSWMDRTRVPSVTKSWA